MLQGHVGVDYKRFLRKGDFEIKFARNGVYYRPYFQVGKRNVVGEWKYQEVRDYTGGLITQPVPHPQGMNEDITSGRIEQGPPEFCGKFTINSLVGPIVRVPSKIDKETSSPQSYPSSRETMFVVKASKDACVPVISQFPTKRQVDIVAGREYFYYLCGLSPREWSLQGPHDPSSDTLDPMAASKLKMSDQEVDHVHMMIKGSIETPNEELALVEQDVE